MSVLCHHRKSVDFSITSSAHSSLPKHLGSISKSPRGSRLATIWHRSHFWVPVFGLTGKSNRNLINVLEVLLLGGPRERVLELRILAAAGGRHLSLPGLRHRVGADPAGCRRRKVARLCRAA